MRDYESTSKALRCCRLTSERGCAECPFSLNSNEKCANLLPNAADAIEELQAQIPRWISVEERLPETDDFVIVAVLDERGDTPYQYTDFGWYLDAARCWIVNAEQRRDITHWMPLPEPPKEDAE